MGCGEAGGCRVETGELVDKVGRGEGSIESGSQLRVAKVGVDDCAYTKKSVSGQG